MKSNLLWPLAFVVLVAALISMVTLVDWWIGKENPSDQSTSVPLCDCEERLYWCEEYLYWYEVERDAWRELAARCVDDTLEVHAR